jgi:hypothetical protein
MITVKRESDLEVHSWSFQYEEREHVLRPHSWVHEERPTKRHKFRITGKWVHYLSGTKPDVPLDVIDEARRRFCETLKVEG